MTIQDNELTIRNAESSDASLLCKWWNDREIMAHAGFHNGLGITKEKVIALISDDSDETRRWLIIEVDSIPVGEMNYKDLGKGKVEIGIKVCESDYQGEGYGIRFIEMLMKELFSMGYKEIDFDPNVRNVRRQHRGSKAGFIRKLFKMVS